MRLPEVHGGSREASLCGSSALERQLVPLKNYIILWFTCPILLMAVYSANTGSEFPCLALSMLMDACRPLVLLYVGCLDDARACVLVLWMLKCDSPFSGLMTFHNALPFPLLLVSCKICHLTHITFLGNTGEERQGKMGKKNVRMLEC